MAPTLKELLGEGYFPRELPPPFTTNSFSSTIVNNTATVPSSFNSGKFARGTPVTFLCPHYITRVGRLQRRLGIPNPSAYYRLCKEIVQSWPDLQQLTHSSILSASKPTVGTGSKRAIYPEHNLDELKMLRAESHIGGRYFVKTDITRCYHSIYTHSIPWALHGKKFAKKNRGQGHVGNRLDKLIQASQDGQTLGIPVGPDTSLVIAEIILGAVDNIIAPQLSSCQGFRYSDDYELCFRTLSDAENALEKLENTLSLFELALNPLKTKINPAPVNFQDSWTVELDQYSIRPSGTNQQNDLIGFFNRAFELSVIYNEQSVLRYAIATFRGVTIDPTNIPLFQKLLLHCISSEQGTISYVLEQYSAIYNGGNTTLPLEFAIILNAHIKHYAPLGHTSEVAWAIWGALAFNISLDNDAGIVVSEMEDSIVALLALDAESKGLFNTRLNSSNWVGHLTTKGLYEEQWLLSYEANIKGWLSNANGIDHVAADPNFNFLKTHNVEFYDRTKTIPMFPPAIQPVSGPTGGISPI